MTKRFVLALLITTAVNVGAYCPREDKRLSYKKNGKKSPPKKSVFMKLDNFSCFVSNILHAPSKIKWLICAFILIAGVIVPCAALPFTMFSVGDPILEDLRLITSDSTRSLLSFTPPFSRDEIRAVLDETQFDELSPHAKEAYLRIQERLNPVMFLSGNNYGIEFNAQSSLDAGFRSNNKINWTDADRLPLPLLDLPVSVYITNTVQLTIRPELSKALFYSDADSHFKHSVPYPLGQIDFHFPLTAYLAMGGSWWNFQIGRDKLSLGTALTGNLMISDNADYYDFARAQLFLRNFKYSFFLVQLPIELEAPFFDKATLPPNEDILTKSVHHYFYLHRLDFRLWNRLSFGIMEGLIVGDSPIELRFLNPLMILHALFSADNYPQWQEGYDMASIVFSVEVNFALTKRLNLQAQLLIDDAESPGEYTDEHGKGKPNALAYLANVNYGIPIGEWDSFFFVEFVYTDPYVYVDNSPFTTLIINSSRGGSGRYLWMGHPSGRDAIFLSLGAQFSRSPALRFGLNFNYEIHGSHGIAWDWGAGASFFAERTPTDPTSQKIVTEVFAEWKPIKKLTLKPRAAFIHATNAFSSGSTSEIGIELGLKATYTY